MAVLAIDWSGRAVGASRHLWIAEARDGELLGLGAGRTRTEVATHLIDRAQRDDALIVGLDFSFSLPAWFLDDRGFADAPALWEAATAAGEEWIRECATPFWGRPGRPRPDLPEHWRVTERDLAAVGGIRPKSTFQLGGAGSVGTGSIRGFPVLARLRHAGFAIWPFDAPARPPVAIEIYPRLMTGAVVKSDPVARRRHLAENLPALRRDFAETAAASEDAFDAAVSAVVMSRHADALAVLPVVDDPILLREGCVWVPPAEPEIRSG
jgi:hypothetical protein